MKLKKSCLFTYGRTSFESRNMALCLNPWYLMCSSYITISVDNAIWGGEEDPVEASMSQGSGLRFQS